MIFFRIGKYVQDFILIVVHRLYKPNEKARPPAGAPAEAGRLQRMLGTTIGIIFWLLNKFKEAIPQIRCPLRH
jgi:hypothetical protein